MACTTHGYNGPWDLVCPIDGWGKLGAPKFLGNQMKQVGNCNTTTSIHQLSLCCYLGGPLSFKNSPFLPKLEPQVRYITINTRGDINGI